MIKIIYITAIIFLVNISFSYSQIKIGIALPLMKSSENPDDKVLGENMLKGINAALTEFNSANPTKQVTILVEDTKRDQSEALQIFNKFGSDSNVIAILGPVYSSELINNAGAAAFHKIPIITPTSTQNFLAEKNPFVFQLNPTYDIRGRVMADFATKELKMNNFAIFSEVAYGSNFSNSFTDQVNKNGGSIVFTEYYSNDSRDLTEALEELRIKIFEKDRFIDFGALTKPEIDKLRKSKFRFSNMDSLVKANLTVSIYKLFGKGADKAIDSLGIQPVQATGTDYTKRYILGYVDAVYIPISSSFEITKVAPQYFSNNINLPILGTSDWNNSNILEENKAYIKLLYFDSDFYLKDKTQEDFAKGESELKNFYFGYDAMKLILDKISEGNNKRQSLSDALEKVTDYKSKHCNFTIKERTNHNMSIMIFRDGKTEKLINYVY